MKRFVKNMKTAAVLGLTSAILISGSAFADPETFEEGDVKDFGEDYNIEYYGGSGTEGWPFEYQKFDLGYLRKGSYENGPYKLYADVINGKILIYTWTGKLADGTVIDETGAAYIVTGSYHNQGQSVFIGISANAADSRPDEEYDIERTNDVIIEASPEGYLRISHYDRNKRNEESRPVYEPSVYRYTGLLSDIHKDDDDGLIGRMNIGPLPFEKMADIAERAGDLSMMGQIPDSYMLPEENYGPENFEDGKVPPERRSVPSKEELSVKLCPHKFRDVPEDAWYHEAVNTLGVFGIFRGKDGSRFYPEDNITRAEFITMIQRISKESYKMSVVQIYGEPRFKDVPEDAWYRVYADWGYDSGIIEGYEGNFSGDRNITREEMAKILMDFYSKEYGTDMSGIEKGVSFTDEDEISEWARDKVKDMAELGLISGMSDGSFNPKGNATRAQAAQMIYNIVLAANEKAENK